MSFIAFLFLLIVHFATGYGIIRLFKIDIGFYKTVSLAFILGVVVDSLLPFFLELLRIPITTISVFASIFITSIVLNIRNLKDLTTSNYFKQFRFMPKFKIYEWPFMVLFAIIIFSSAWRAFYYPPISRDALSGPEAIAEYTVKEHTMLNSVLTVNLETTNNHQKSPYLVSLQVIYKMAGFPFGQMWLTIIFISFTVFIYHVFRERLHPILACLLLLFLFAIPEMFAYTYLILYDYSNMILFFLGAYFLFGFFERKEARYFYFSVLMFGLATYIRMETIALVAMLLPALWICAYKNGIKLLTTLFYSALIIAIPLIFYILWMKVYIVYYMQGDYDVAAQLNKHLFDIKSLIERFKAINSELIFSKKGIVLYGYIVYLFILLFVVNLIAYRKMIRWERNWLYVAAIVYLGLPILGHIIPLIDVNNTTKRGLFKLFPLLLMVLAEGTLLRSLSEKIYDWENKTSLKPLAQTQPVRAQNSIAKKTKSRK